jgi:small neutral amino acid transporter SnatA (MarC family)
VLALGAAVSTAAHGTPLPWRSSLALPVLATPATLAAAVTYGADRGEGETAVAAVIVLGVAAGLVAARIGRFESEVDALSRLTGAIMIVVSAGLVVSGVRAI